MAKCKVSIFVPSNSMLMMLRFWIRMTILIMEKPTCQWTIKSHCGLPCQGLNNWTVQGSPSCSPFWSFLEPPQAFVSRWLSPCRLVDRPNDWIYLWPVRGSKLPSQIEMEPNDQSNCTASVKWFVNWAFFSIIPSHRIPKPQESALSYPYLIISLTISIIQSYLIYLAGRSNHLFSQRGFPCCIWTWKHNSTIFDIDYSNGRPKWRAFLAISWLTGSWLLKLGST